MTDREERISQWIFENGVKKARQQERRRRIIPSSTDSITHTPVGDPLDAMEKIAFYFGDHPELPIVEVGSIDGSAIGVTFGEPVNLEYPFQFDSAEDGSHWKISHNDALALSTGETYGWQTAALTAIGNSAAGAKMLLNTNRWHVLGLGGLDQFISAVMVGQVMEHATEPWSAKHHIWLVGYRELGPKLINFLTMYHDASYFHLVETVEQITAEDIAGTTATLYVKNSNAASLEAYKRLLIENPNRIGMLTDTIVTEQAMFISENDDDSASILNAAPWEIQFWPNVIGESHPLYLAMELTWEKYEEEAEKARQAVESLTMADFFPEGAEKTVPPAAQDRTGSTSISVEDLEALYNRDPAERQGQAQTDPIQPEPAAARDSTTDRVASPLTLLGQPKLFGTNGGVVEGKPAEAVAYLYFHGLACDGVDVSQALWPEVDNEGENARKRRTRTTKTIKDTLPGSFRVEDRWTLDPLATDLDSLLVVLTSYGEPQDVIEACHAIEPPLQGCAAWADEPRTQVVKQLREALEGVMDRALDDDQFEIVKAVRQAIKKL